MRKKQTILSAASTLPGLHFLYCGKYLELFADYDGKKTVYGQFDPKIFLHDILTIRY